MVIRQVSECLLVYFLSVISTLFPTPVSFLIQKWNSESHNQVCIINRKASILKMSPKSDQNHLSNVDESGLLTQISQFLSLPCIFSVRRVWILFHMDEAIKIWRDRLVCWRWLELELLNFFVFCFFLGCKWKITYRSSQISPMNILLSYNPQLFPLLFVPTTCP